MKQKTTVLKIAVISAFHFAWFWVPIWVLFYKRFTDYSGVAMLEALSMFAFLAMIVPGGLLADYIGRKRLLIFASITNAIGAAIVGCAGSFTSVAVGIAVMSLSGGLFTASIEAMLYDFLKTEKREEQYKKIWGKMTTVRMLTSAAASLVGGYIYSIDVRLPWFGVALASLAAFFVSLTLREPRIETPHDSFPQFLREAGKGVTELFRKDVWKLSIPLLLIGIFFTTDSSGLWDIQAVEYGFSSQTLGVLLTVTYLFLAVVSWYAAKITRKFSSFGGILLFALIWAILWFVSGVSGGLIGALLLILRSSFSVVADIQSSGMWNGMISSRVRATTLSTITIIRGLPYILVASNIGMVIDSVGIHWLIRVFALLMVVLLLPTCVWWIKKGRTRAI